MSEDERAGCATLRAIGGLHAAVVSLSQTWQAMEQKASEVERISIKRATRFAPR
ncbi:hypothetical protein [Bradyrhizobium macuxiense]|uniref:hypothetical protein n=1 Tax=Bradyrhizobium macuxiense TaxID=1755647 RepID=UPI0013663D76|nr:hypothetical protein [Bradyrhizobium macuxiense]